MNNPTSEFQLKSVEIRALLADKLIEMAQIISVAEQQAKNKEASGALDILNLVNDLKTDASGLRENKFRFLVVGDFNRGKSTILNVILGQSVLPMGGTPTTAIPTFVKYGTKKEAIVYKKAIGSQKRTSEPLSFEDYKKRYTLNSKDVKNSIKKKLNTAVEKYKDGLAKWLKRLDYAEIYCPIEILQKGVEFIDSAGLNHTEEENIKTLSYISQCHVIIFVLGADYQFTKEEKGYLETLLGKKEEIEKNENSERKTSRSTNNSENSSPRPIFYLINKWETVPEEEREDVQDHFIGEFSELFNLTENQADAMWGNSIFNVYAKTAIDKLEAGLSIEDTGLDAFQKRLDYFLTNERLKTELLKAVQTSESVKEAVDQQVQIRLRNLKSPVDVLEEKIEKVSPHIEDLKKIPRELEKKTIEKRDACTGILGSEYQKYFRALVDNFERDFEIPSVAGLRENQREEYTRDLQNRLSRYREAKLSAWQLLTRDKLQSFQATLREAFDEGLVDYVTGREKIREELISEDFSIENKTTTSPYKSKSLDQSSLETSDASATGKMVLGAAGGTLGTFAAGVTGATVANVAGAHVVLGTVGAGLALTPVGWALIGASAVVGGGLAWWQRRKEVQKFQSEMSEKVKNEFSKLLEPRQVENFEEKIKETFVSFENLAKKMNEDVLSLEGSLHNLLKSKKDQTINIEKEEERLNSFVERISIISASINKEYQKVFESAKPKGNAK